MTATGEKTFFARKHLFEGIPVGLQADFDHLERVHDNRFCQARAEAGHGQRLQGGRGRRVGFRGQTVEMAFVCCGWSDGCLPEITPDSTFSFFLKGGKKKQTPNLFPRLSFVRSENGRLLSAGAVIVAALTNV